jgi:hypothetical membrane protein
VWARAALGGIVAYVGIDVALVFLRPELSVLHSAESDYGSAGAYGWLMDANFVLRGLFGVAVVEALARSAPPRLRPRLRPGLALLGLWSLASALLAFLPDDPVGTPLHGVGRAHLALAALAFVGVLLGTRLTTRALAADEAWRALRPLLAVLSWGALVPALLLAHARLRPESLGGLYEKLFLALELAWLFAAAGRVALRPAAAAEREAAPEPVALP